MTSFHITFPKYIPKIQFVVIFHSYFIFSFYCFDKRKGGRERQRCSSLKSSHFMENKVSEAAVSLVKVEENVGLEHNPVNTTGNHKTALCSASGALVYSKKEKQIKGKSSFPVEVGTSVLYWDYTCVRMKVIFSPYSYLGYFESEGKPHASP